MSTRVLVFLSCLLIAAPASAEIHTRIVVLLGVKLTPAQATAADVKQLDKHGLELFTDPSLSWGSPVKPTTYAGKVLANKLVDRTTTAAPIALPAQAAIDAVKKDLDAAGLPTDVQLVALVAYSGGK